MRAGIGRASGSRLCPLACREPGLLTSACASRPRSHAPHVDDAQVAGYSVHYRGLVYVTVRGAGALPARAHLNISACRRGGATASGHVFGCWQACQWLSIVLLRASHAAWAASWHPAGRRRAGAQCDAGLLTALPCRPHGATEQAGRGTGDVQPLPGADADLAGLLPRHNNLFGLRPLLACARSELRNKRKELSRHAPPRPRHHAHTRVCLISCVVLWSECTGCLIRSWSCLAVLCCQHGRCLRCAGAG